MKTDTTTRRLKFFEKRVPRGFVSSTYRKEKAVLYGSSPAVVLESARPMTKARITKVMTGLGWKRSKPWVRVSDGWETFFSRID